MIIDALKKRLYTENDRAPERWMKELPAVVWGLRTQATRNMGVSPYFMVYGTEAVLPSDVTFGSPRVEISTSLRLTSPENSKSTAQKKSA